MKINKNEMKTIKKFLDFMEKNEIEKIIKVRLEIESKKLSFDSIPISYSVIDYEGNIYNPDDLVPLRITEIKKLGLTLQSAIVGVKKETVTFKDGEKIGIQKK